MILTFQDEFIHENNRTLKFSDIDCMVCVYMLYVCSHVSMHVEARGRPEESVSLAFCLVF